MKEILKKVLPIILASWFIMFELFLGRFIYLNYVGENYQFVYVISCVVFAAGHYVALAYYHITKKKDLKL